MSVKVYILRNKTYQPFQIIINGSTHLVGARGDNDKIIITQITKQIEHLIKRGMITVKPKR